MNILVASDSFKGSASSYEVAKFIEKGIRRVDEKADIIKVPVADGGEGTVEAVVSSLNGSYKTIEVTDPYGSKAEAVYGILENQIAIIEMAQASGLHFKKANDSVWNATSYGTGELILAALDDGVKEIYIGLGGSATNDGGAGMAQALGATLLTAEGQEIDFGAKGLEQIDSINIDSMDERLKKVSITVLSDVTNPLTGENGASAVFGPQKGAEGKDVPELDAALVHFRKKVERALSGNWSDVEGAGAAGGLGFGLMAFCGAKLESGIEAILELIRLEDKLKQADLVITGEGKMDGQSVKGKAPVGIAKLAKKYRLPVVAIVGSSDNDLSEIYKSGIDLVIHTINKPMLLEKAMENAESLIENAGETVIRAFYLSSQN